jgi:hypothetical protein
MFARPYLENSHHNKKGLGEWLKLQALILNLGTRKKKKKC